MCWFKHLHTRSTRTDKSDVQKVLKAVQDNPLLMVSPGRKHKGFSAMTLNPLFMWNKDDTTCIAWIEKKKSFIKNRGMTEQDEDEEDEECEDDEEEDELHEDEEEDCA